MNLLWLMIVTLVFRSLPLLLRTAEQDRFRLVEQEAIREAEEARERDRVGVRSREGVGVGA